MLSVDSLAWATPCEDLVCAVAADKMKRHSVDHTVLISIISIVAYVRVDYHNQNILVKIDQKTTTNQ